MSIPAESIANCDTKKFFNRANLYFTITYIYIMITICKSPLSVSRLNIHNYEVSRHLFYPMSLLFSVSYRCEHLGVVCMLRHLWKGSYISRNHFFNTIVAKCRHLLSTPHVTSIWL